LVECRAWDRWPPRFLIHDRDSRYGAIFERRLWHLGVAQVRTPFRAPRANAISERWVKSVRTEYLDHLFIITEGHLRRAISSYVTYFNCWRPHRSLGQRAPLGPTAFQIRAWEAKYKIISEPVLGGLHHVYRAAWRTRFLRPSARRLPSGALICRVVATSVRPCARGRPTERLIRYPAVSQLLSTRPFRARSRRSRRVNVRR
jgi:hypothetical protein